MFDAPEIGRDDVSDIFNEFMNVLQINNINTSTKNTYKYRDYLSSGDALPPEACHVVGSVGNLLGGQVEYFCTWDFNPLISAFSIRTSSF